MDVKGQYTEEATITRNISLWEGVLVLKSQYIHTSRENKQQNSFEKNISLWEGVLVLPGKYTEEATITKKYFTLGGCFVLERPIYRRSYNNSSSGNISLWEGVVVLKGPSFVVV